MRFVFRADGNSKIGLGHVTRCIALADKLKRYGDVQFISKPLPIKIPFKMHKLPDVDKKNDAKLTRNLLRKLRPDVVIVDHHDLDQKYLNTIKAFTNLLVTIDDLNREICSDVVVNVNSFSLRMKYKCDKGRVFLGPKYALVKRVVARKSLTAAARKVLVSMGGADVLNLTPLVVRALRHISDIEVTVVVGPAFENEKRIRNAIAGDKRFSVMRSNNLPEMMTKHDIAICGGGTTLYELAATGTPAIIVCQAENQFINARELHKRSLVNLGMGNKLGENKLKKAIILLLRDYKLRKLLSINGRRMVDCKGPERVANIILKGLKEKRIELKPVEKEDTIAIWEWKNEEVTRMNSFNTKFIPFSEHTDWFEKALMNKKKKMFVICNNSRKIGFLRIDFHAKPEMHISISRKYRGLGFGSRAIRIACQSLAGVPVTAKIKPSNKASIKAFERAGFGILKKTRSEVTLTS